MNDTVTTLDLEKYLQTYSNVDGIRLYNLIDNITIDTTNIVANLFDVHNVTQADAWTTISYKYYRTIALWWLVVKCNRDVVTNPLDMPTAGTAIRVPKPALVQSIINTLNNQ